MGYTAEFVIQLREKLAFLLHFRPSALDFFYIIDLSILLSLKNGYPSIVLNYW